MLSRRSNLYPPPLTREQIGIGKEPYPRYGWLIECKKCKRKFLDPMDLLSNGLCEKCDTFQRIAKKRERREVLSRVEIGLLAVLKRRISSSLSRTFSQNKKHIGKSNLTMNYLLGIWEAQGGRCALTGQNLSLGSVVNLKFEPSLLSIDRINPEVGYIEGNVQLTTLQANLSKNRLTNKGLLEFCRLVIAEAERDPSKFAV